MGFDRPATFLAAIVALPLLYLLHRLLRRPRTVAVSSLFLWRDLLDGAEPVVRPWRLTMLLVLESLACVSILAALAGPYRESAAAAETWTVLVDRRPGMGAVAAGNRGETRLRAGVRRALDWLRRAPGRPAVRVLTVPQLAGGPRTFSAAGAALAAYLDALDPAATTANLEAAVAAIEPLGGVRLVVTDEDPSSDPDENLHWLGTGGPGDNLGIVWARVAGSRGARVSVGVLNGGARRRVAKLRIGTSVATIDSRSAAVEPGAVWSGEPLPLPETMVPASENAVLRVSLEGEDELAADDEVVLTRSTRRVALVSDEPVPAPVRRAISALGAEAVRVDEGAGGGLPRLYWKLLPPDGERPELLVAAEGRWNDLTFGPRYTPRSVAEGEGAVDFPLKPCPSRVTGALKVRGAAGWSVAAYGLDDTGQRSPLVLVRDRTFVCAFDPVHEAPGWDDTDAFPAFFHHTLGRAGRAFAIEGLLSPADTRLGTSTAAPGPPPAASAATAVAREALAAWFLLAALLALGAIHLLEV